MKNLILALCCVGLAGCSHQSHKAEAAAQDQMIEKQLAQTANDVESALRQLAETQYTPPPPALATEPLVSAQGNMGAPISLDWSGPVEPLLTKVAQLSNYKVKVLGPPPAIPILVSVHTKNEPIADVIKNASLQLGHRADVVVYPKDKIIELRYHTI